MKWPESEFWTYSLEIYARHDVRLNCLDLQDGAGADVNILLLCLWLASLGKPPLSAEVLARINQAAAPWRELVILPLRQARRGLATFTALPEGAALKTRVQELELDAEHRAQLALEAGVLEYLGGEAGGFSPAESAAASIGHYLKIITSEPGAAATETARRLVKSAFSTCRP